jgi:hypothetical protein
MRSEIAPVHDESSLRLRLKAPGKWSELELIPYGRDEPMWLKYSGMVRYKASGVKFEGTSKWIVTRHRLLIVASPGIGTAGLNRQKDEHALISLELMDFNVEPRGKRLGKPLMRVRLVGVSQDFEIELKILEKSYPQFLEALSSASTDLDEKAAAVVNERNRQKTLAAERATADEEIERSRIAAERFGSRQTGSAPNRSSRLRLNTGLLDHRKTWRYRVAATSEDCVSGFITAFSGSGGLVLKAKWSVTRSPNGAVAVYEGRKGLAVLGTAFSETAQSEEQSAVGSEVRFEIEGTDNGRTICAMWLASRASRIGFTMDGRFFRPYMRAVEDELRRVDPSLQVMKD